MTRLASHLQFRFSGGMTNAPYRFSARAGDMDREQIHAWLSREAYWAKGRPRAVQDAAIDASINFGMFDSLSGRQVAYARVVTDSVTFAWLCDVFVDQKVRGHGVGVALMENVCSLLDDLHMKRVVLATGDAHGLYEKFGFEPLAQPERWMERTAATPKA
jgi:GNAT superfamily N-acetyltransferase